VDGIKNPVLPVQWSADAPITWHVPSAASTTAARPKAAADPEDTQAAGATEDVAGGVPVQGADANQEQPPLSLVLEKYYALTSGTAALLVSSKKVRCALCAVCCVPS